MGAELAPICLTNLLNSFNYQYSRLKQVSLLVKRDPKN